jgi:hypothetical protein
MPTAATPTGFNIDNVQVGPSNLFYIMPVTISAPFSGDRLVMDNASLTPDINTYTSCVCLGLINKENDVKGSTKYLDLDADQFYTALSAHSEQEGMEYDVSTMQHEQLKMALMMSNSATYSATSGSYAGISVGGNANPTFGAFAIISPVRGFESTDVIVHLMYRGLSEANYVSKYGRKVLATLPWKIKAYADPNRVGGKQLWNEYRYTTRSVIPV